MPKFEVKFIEEALKLPDGSNAVDYRARLLNNLNGEFAEIDMLGAGLSGLWFKYEGYDKLQPVIFSYIDLAAAEKGMPRPRFGDDVKELKPLAYEIKRSRPTQAGGAVITPGNRLKHGIIRNMGGEETHRFEVTHQATDSILHGYAKNTLFHTRDFIELDDYAALLFNIPLSIGLPGFANRCFAGVVYTLTDDGLYQRVTANNRQIDWQKVPLSFANHTSFLIGEYPLDSHYAEMRAKAMLAKGEQNHPTGEVVIPNRFYDQGGSGLVRLSSADIDDTYILDSSSAAFRLMADAGIGIMVDSQHSPSSNFETRDFMATVWTNGQNRRFIAYEPFAGTQAGALSRGGREPWENAAPGLDQLLLSRNSIEEVIHTIRKEYKRP